MENSSFTRQFINHSNYLRGFAMKLAQDKNNADDLFQDTAFKAFRYKDKFKPDTNMRAWLSTIMKNSFLNQFRSKKNRQEIQDSSPDSFLIDSGTTVRNEGESNIAIHEITRAIDRLGDDLKVPFLMAYQGYQYNEICEHMGGIPIGTIKSRIQNARKVLKTQLSTWES
ncbi:MAG: RNA polymerase sigma factor [Bacteroidota bacterium]